MRVRPVSSDVFRLIIAFLSLAAWNVQLTCNQGSTCLFSVYCEFSADQCRAMRHKAKTETWGMRKFVRKTDSVVGNGQSKSAVSMRQVDVDLAGICVLDRVQDCFLRNMVELRRRS